MIAMNNPAPVEPVNPGCQVFVGEKQTRGFALLSMRRGFELEVFTSLKASRGRSMLSIVKERYNLKGNKYKVFEAFCKIVTEETGIEYKPAQFAKQKK